MTDILRKELEDRLDEAINSKDQERVNVAHRAIERAMIECLSHTSERVKRIERDSSETREDVREIKVSVKEIADDRISCSKRFETNDHAIATMQNEFRSMRDKARGARMLWNVLKVLAGAGGGAVLLKLLGG